jgi:hypothetical protein
VKTTDDVDEDEPKSGASQCSDPIWLSSSLRSPKSGLCSVARLMVDVEEAPIWCLNSVREVERGLFIC